MILLLFVYFLHFYFRSLVHRDIKTFSRKVRKYLNKTAGEISTWGTLLSEVLCAEQEISIFK